MDFLSWEFALKFVVFALVYWDGIFLGVFVHELGHSLAALLLTKQGIRMRVGMSDHPALFRLGRLDLGVSLKSFRYGVTEYDRSIEGKPTQVLVALAGPAASLAMVGFCLGWLLVYSIWSWTWIVGLALFVANLRILVVALWPLEYRPDKKSDEVWLSDSLDVWRMLKNGD